MLTEDPKVRKAAYYFIALLGVVAIALDHIPGSGAANASDAIAETIVYLSTIFGLVAAGNVKQPPKE